MRWTVSSSSSLAFSYHPLPLSFYSRHGSIQILSLLQNIWFCALRRWIWSASAVYCRSKQPLSSPWDRATLLFNIPDLVEETAALAPRAVSWVISFTDLVCSWHRCRAFAQVVLIGASRIGPDSIVVWRIVWTFEAQASIMQCFQLEVLVLSLGCCIQLAQSCRLPWLWKLVHLPFWWPFMPFALKVLYRFPPASRPIDMLGLVITDNSLVSDAG